MRGMTEHEFRSFIIDIYDGGYRAEDIDELTNQFELDEEELDKVCYALKKFDEEVKSEEGIE